jgi:hypothetical protein
VLSCQAGSGQSARRRGLDTIAGKPNLKLLIGCVPTEVDRRLTVQACSVETTIVTPVEADPRSALSGHLILNMRHLVELLIIIDSEWIAALSDRAARAGALRREEAGTDDIVTKAEKL